VLSNVPGQRDEEKEVLPGERRELGMGEEQEGRGHSSGVCASMERLCREPGKMLLSSFFFFSRITNFFQTSKSIHFPRAKTLREFWLW